MGRCEVTNDTCLQGAGARFTSEQLVSQAVSAVACIHQNSDGS